MTTYTFSGYNFTDYVPVSGAPAVGATFRISPDFDAAADALTFTLDDDDTTLSGSSGSNLDSTQQTGTVTDGSGSTIYTGVLRVGWQATFTLPDGSTVHVWDVWTGNSGGSRVGLIADGELPPGVTFQITDYLDTSDGATWPSYSTIATPTTDPDSDQTILGGTLADSLYGGAGNDSINAGAGNDTVDGGSGNDTIDGGTGNDAIYGGTGDDSLTGGSGDDQIWGDDGADTLSGGAGTDNLTGGAGDDLFLINDADDVDNIDGGTDTDTIAFSASTQGVTATWSGVTSGTYDFDGTTGTGTFNNIESISGTDHDDTFDAALAGAGVSLDGGAGDDVITGSDFADSLRGGTGSDTITTGTGADTIAATAGDSGIDTVTDFDLTGLGSGPTTDQLDTSALTGGTGAGGTVRAFDVDVRDDGLGNALLTFPSGEQLVLTGVDYTTINSASSLHAMGIPCFVAGTRIATPQGPRLIEDIRVGDLVLTRDSGAQPVIWHAARALGPKALAGRAALRPVEVFAAPGELRPLRVSAQHAVLVPIDGTAHLVRAGHLAALAPKRARVMHSRKRVSYHHLLLPAHALICAEGHWSESLWPGPMAFAALSPADRLGLLRLRPDLARGLLGLAPVERAYGPPAQVILRRRDVQHLLRAHAAA